MTLKGFRKDFVAVKKSRKVSGLVIYPCLKDTDSTAVKGMQSFKLGMSKGYHLSMEGIRKGYTPNFRSRMVYKRESQNPPGLNAVK